MLLIVRIILIILIFASVSHAFVQSSLPKETSSSESNKVGEIVGEIIPPETPPGAYVQKNLRKLAHFTEFANIGVFCALYAVIFHFKSKWAHIAIIPVGMGIALLDETIQIFSERGPSVTDIWIDVLGYLTATVAVYAVFVVIYFIKWRVSVRKSSAPDSSEVPYGQDN